MKHSVKPRIVPIVAQAAPGAVPRKGRGAVSNIAGRYEVDRREAFDDGWCEDDEAPSALPTVVFEETAKSIISHNDSPDIPFNRSLNPYRGCEHGCIYCYARPNHAYLGLSPGLDFESKIYAKVNAAELLERELAVRAYRAEPMCIGAVTDAYQPTERQLRITRACLEILARTRHPVTLITKSGLIARDIDVLAPMAEQNLVYVHVSVTTLDHVLARSLEPRCASPARRLDTIRRLAAAGVPVGVSVAPIIPFVNEPEIERILAAAREAGASCASYVVIRLPWEVRPLFAQWLGTQMPDRAERVLARIADMRAGAGAGRLNDARFGARMKGEGVWADLIRQRFRKAAERLGYARELPRLDSSRFSRPASAGAQGVLF